MNDNNFIGRSWKFKINSIFRMYNVIASLNGKCPLIPLHICTHSPTLTDRHTHIFVKSALLFSRVSNHFSTLSQTPRAYCPGSWDILYHGHELKVELMPSTSFCISDYLADFWKGRSKNVIIHKWQDVVHRKPWRLNQKPTRSNKWIHQSSSIKTQYSENSDILKHY